jgi:hypothetical protein
MTIFGTTTADSLEFSSNAMLANATGPVPLTPTSSCTPADPANLAHH